MRVEELNPSLRRFLTDGLIREAIEEDYPDGGIVAIRVNVDVDQPPTLYGIISKKAGNISATLHNKEE